MTCRHFTIGLASIMGLLGVLSQIWAYDNKGTHQALSERAVQPQNSTLDDFLKVVLAPIWMHCGVDGCPVELVFKEFDDGINQIVNNERVQRWIILGSELEDDPSVRVQ